VKQRKDNKMAYLHGDKKHEHLKKLIAAYNIKTNRADYPDPGSEALKGLLDCHWDEVGAYRSAWRELVRALEADLPEKRMPEWMRKLIEKQRYDLAYYE